LWKKRNPFKEVEKPPFSNVSKRGEFTQKEPFKRKNFAVFWTLVEPGKMRNPNGNHRNPRRRVPFG